MRYLQYAPKPARGQGLPGGRGRPTEARNAGKAYPTALPGF